MVHRSKIGHRAQRTGCWAESKCTNCNSFDPYYHSAEYAYFEKYYDELNSTDEVVIKFENTNDKFVMPVTINEISMVIRTLPSDFLEGLTGIILLSGSNKQHKASWSSLFRFGMYYFNCIFLYPFPKNQLVSSSKTLPAPHIKRDYERAGAKYSQKNKRWFRTFTKESLKQFYLKDILVHEIGHHVDRFGNKSREKSERYAEWFATEYGFKQFKK